MMRPNYHRAIRPKLIDLIHEFERAHQLTTERTGVDAFRTSPWTWSDGDRADLQRASDDASIAFRLREILGKLDAQGNASS